jgi:hypothetical protein
MFEALAYFARAGDWLEVPPPKSGSASFGVSFQCIDVRRVFFELHIKDDTHIALLDAI